MAWTQGPSKERVLVRAVRAFLAHGTTGNIERLQQALDQYDSDTPTAPSAY